MRVLTKLELSAFEQAFSFMDRVGCLSHVTNNMFEIKVQNENGVSSLPTKVVQFIANIGGLEKANQFFNGHMKEKTFERFVNKIMENREQPKDYFSTGVLIIQQIHVQTFEYSEAS